MPETSTLPVITLATLQPGDDLLVIRPGATPAAFRLLLATAPAVIAASGTDRSTAAALFVGDNIVTTSLGSDSVVLPTAPSGPVTVIVRGSVDGQIWPPSGHQFFGLAVDAAETVAAIGTARFVLDATATIPTWYS